jgi:succinate dehydrogenase / fumarate reductase flavoprotein subunit/fumarate reductase (CoM/CoB) subunit A
MNDYGNDEHGNYVVTRDKATHAILKEVEAGRGSPAGGAYLSFEHIPEAALREAFGPVIDRLAANGIDLAKMPIEVSPIAHYHMGGVRVGAAMETRVPALFAAGELVAGANGANRLSGNAITEALVFGRLAGEAAAVRAGSGSRVSSGAALELTRATSIDADRNLAGAIAELQAVMADFVGPFRTRDGLGRALALLVAIGERLGDAPPGVPGAYNMARVDWFDLRSMLLVAETIARAALAREESRGAHQREDFPGMEERWTLHQTVVLRDGGLMFGRTPVRGAPMSEVA